MPVGKTNILFLSTVAYKRHRAPCLKNRQTAAHAMSHTSHFGDFNDYTSMVYFSQTWATIDRVIINLSWNNNNNFYASIWLSVLSLIGFQAPDDLQPKCQLKSCLHTESSHLPANTAVSQLVILRPRQATAHTVSRWTPTMATRVWSQVRSCEFCGGQTGNKVGILRVLRFL
jgi:hypothetical protein